MSNPPTQTKLVFHIGFPKTGSTSIQEAFATGGVKVAGRRILYPAHVSHNYLPRQFEAWLRRGVVEPGAPGRPGLADLATLLAARDFDDAVISSELFEGTDPADFDRVAREFLLPQVDDYRVICYVRPHAARILSSYAEQVKSGMFEGDMAAFHAKMLGMGRLFYAPRLAGWSAIHGDRFIARPMIRDLLHGRSVVEDFARTAFGPEAELQIAQTPPSNESLCLEDLALVGLLQRMVAQQPRPLRHALGWALAADFAKLRRERPGTRLELHRAMAEEIRRTYLEDARALDAGPFAAAPVMVRELDKAVDLARPEPQSLDPADVFGADELRNITVLTQLVAEMLQNGAGHQWRSFLVRRRDAGVFGADELAGAEPGADAEEPSPRAARRGPGAGPKGPGAGLRAAKPGRGPRAAGKPGAGKQAGGKPGAGKSGPGKPGGKPAGRNPGGRKAGGPAGA